MSSTKQEEMHLAREPGLPIDHDQALLRWKTAESLKLYSYLSDEKYCSLC